MKYNKGESVSNLLSHFLRSQGLETPLLEHRVLSSWENVVGERAGSLTGKMQIRNQVLYVEIKSPTLRNELMMRRHQLVKSLNEIVGGLVIRDIEIR